jgi:hypothetical protein
VGITKGEASIGKREERKGDTKEFGRIIVQDMSKGEGGMVAKG